MFSRCDEHLGWRVYLFNFFAKIGQKKYAIKQLYQRFIATLASDLFIQYIEFSKMRRLYCIFGVEKFEFLKICL